MPVEKLQGRATPGFQHHEETTIAFPNTPVLSEVKEREGVSLADSDVFYATQAEQEYFKSRVQSAPGERKYRFQEMLGAGGMGAIFHVVEQHLHRSLAMKVLLPSFKHDPESLSNFVTEAKITAFLEHPGIIHIHELGLLSEAGIFFTMERVQGESLKNILHEMQQENLQYVKTYTMYPLLKIFQKVCDAVSFAHSNHLLHLDIKPQNILIGHYGEVFLMDWGLAKILGRPEEEHDPLKQEFLNDVVDAFMKKQDRIEGSPAFMSPEQARGDFALLDTRSDIFLLGATLYYMFTLEPPYVGDDVFDASHKARNRELIPPQSRNQTRQIPEELCRIIMKALAYRQEDRYQSVQELSKDIDALFAGKWSPHTTKRFAVGETLIQEGEIGKEAYLLVRGSVLITKKTKQGKVVILRTCDVGDIVGEMALISAEPRSASVRALEETEVAVLTRPMILRHLKNLPPYIEKIISVLTHRLRTLGPLVHPHLASDSSFAVLKQLRLIVNERSYSQPERFPLPFQDTIEEISEDLGIPEHMVQDIFSDMINKKLLVRQDDTMFIPDMKKFMMRF